MKAGEKDSGPSKIHGTEQLGKTLDLAYRISEIQCRKLRARYSAFSGVFHCR